MIWPNNIPDQIVFRPNMIPTKQYSRPNRFQTKYDIAKQYSRPNRFQTKQYSRPNSFQTKYDLDQMFFRRTSGPNTQWPNRIQTKSSDQIFHGQTLLRPTVWGPTQLVSNKFQTKSCLGQLFSGQLRFSPTIYRPTITDQSSSRPNTLWINF